MKTLKRRIQTPMVLLVILAPLATLLVFNLLIRLYVDKNARAELKTQMQSVQLAAAHTLTDESALSAGKIEETARALSEELRGGTLLSGTELLVLNSDGMLLYPAHTARTGDALLQRAAARVRAGLASGRVTELAATRQRALLAAETVRTPGGRAVTLALVARTDSASGILRITNLLLVGIMLSGIAIGILVSGRISNRLAKTVRRLCRAAERIGAGHFEPPPKTPTGVTEFDSLVGSMAQMAVRLAAYDNAQRVFLQNASHELRTPLMSIQGYAEGITQDVVPDVKKAAGIIADESRRLHALVEELLTLSRLDSRAYEHHGVPTDLCVSLAANAKRLGGVAMQSGREIRLDLPGRPVWALADERLLDQSVGNILANCLRYARRVLTVSLRAESGRVCIRIADDGSGISPADLPHLFERFYKGGGGHAGLGLAIARAAVSLMGGTLTAQNDAQTGGAVFLLCLPAASPPPTGLSPAPRGR